MVQEVKELRNTAVRLVSQLAQIPKSAAYFKDVLLAMPAGRREMLQVRFDLLGLGYYHYFYSGGVLFGYMHLFSLNELTITLLKIAPGSTLAHPEKY